MCLLIFFCCTEVETMSNRFVFEYSYILHFTPLYQVQVLLHSPAKLCHIFLHQIFMLEFHHCLLHRRNKLCGQSIVCCSILLENLLLTPKRSNRLRTFCAYPEINSNPPYPGCGAFTKKLPMLRQLKIDFAHLMRFNSKGS